MLVDLGRNDVGRVAATGSVRLTDRMVVERYSHVMHIVSNVEGNAASRARCSIDVLRAAFPAGTVSGAPKVRAMEIIDELEPTKRGIYAGAVGYLGFNGDMDTRDRDPHRRAQGRHDCMCRPAAASSPTRSRSEWQETQNKARAVCARPTWHWRVWTPDSTDYYRWHHRGRQ